MKKITKLVPFGWADTLIYIPDEDALLADSILINSVNKIFSQIAQNYQIDMGTQNDENTKVLFIGDDSSVVGKLSVWIHGFRRVSIFIEETKKSKNNESVYAKIRELLVNWKHFDNDMGAAIIFDRSKESDNEVIKVLQTISRNI